MIQQPPLHARHAHHAQAIDRGVELKLPQKGERTVQHADIVRAGDHDVPTSALIGHRSNGVAFVAEVRPRDLQRRDPGLEIVPTRTAPSAVESVAVGTS